MRVEVEYSGQSKENKDAACGRVSKSKKSRQEFKNTWGGVVLVVLEVKESDIDTVGPANLERRDEVMR
jgi:hypothetical protein